MKDTKEKKLPFNFIETSRRDVANRGTDYRLTIAYHPNPESLEVQLYEKRFSLSDTESEKMSTKKVIERIRMNAATELFERFYQDNFLK